MDTVISVLETFYQQEKQRQQQGEDQVRERGLAEEEAREAKRRRAREEFKITLKGQLEGDSVMRKAKRAQEINEEMKITHLMKA